MKRVVSTKDIVGGSPCIEGTRLTCANVAQRLRYESIAEYLRDYPYLEPGDIRNALDYCASKQCVDDQVIAYCEHCTLDTDPDYEPEEPREEVWVLAKEVLEREH